MMKKTAFFFLTFVAFSFSFYSCKTNTDELWDSIHQLDDRVTTLENISRQLNGNITTLQALVQALQNNVSITKVTPLMEEGQTIGYTITFSKGAPITIYHGEKGEQGIAGSTPQIGVKADIDGIYYWTLNGKWLTDETGERVRAVGEDGVSGENGKDAITPQLKIQDERWLLSTDDGTSWTDLGQATGDKGDSLFKEVAVDEENNIVIITLADGTVLKLPQIKADDSNAFYLVTTFKTTVANQTIQVARDVESYPVAGIGNHLLTIDYGDGTKGISSTHTYAAAGEYKVSFALENEVVEIGDRAFYNCGNLVDIVYPESVTKIGYATFHSTGLIDIIIPNTVTYINEAAFSGCKNAQQIRISNSVNFLGKQLFWQTTGELYIDCDIPSYGYLNGVVFSSKISKVIIGKNVKSIGDYAFCNSKQLLTVEYEKGNQLIHIGAGAFGMCPLIEEMPIPSSVNTIGDYPFSLCDNLKAFKIVGTGSGKFWVTSGILMSSDNQYSIICYPPNKEGDSYSLYFAQSIANSAFRGAQYLKEVIFSNPINDIGAAAFSDCANLTNVENFESMKIVVLGDSMFGGCENLAAIQLPETLEEIGNFAFQRCSKLTQITIPGKVRVIGESAFDGCIGLSGDLFIPDNVETINRGAFLNCTGFSGSLILGEKVNNIGESAFLKVVVENNGECDYVAEYSLNFSKVYCKSLVPPSFVGESNPIKGMNGSNLPYLAVPKGCKNTYIEKGWDFFDVIEEVEF